MKRQKLAKTSSGGQRTIANFFRPVSTTTAKSSGQFSSSRIKSTNGEPIGVTRSDSVISATSSGDFNDVSSSDTSFDTSTEITNFRNPNLEKYSRTSQPVRDVLPTELKISTRKLTNNPRMNLKRSSSSLSDNGHKAPKRSGLSEEQQSIIKAVVEEKLNVFYTGSAGTGKSVVLRELVVILRRIYYDRVGITASTAMAAVNIQGQTLHKFLGIGLGTEKVEALVARIKKRAEMLRKWQSLKVLVIDEISMIDGRLFDKLDLLGQQIRGNNKPFGGIQIVCTGDFFQLPPVSQGSCFCFQSKAWARTIGKTILLTKVFRQQGDNELIEMLNSLRYGTLDPTIINKFTALSRRVVYKDGIEPTELYPTRVEVKAANEARLRQLKSKEVVFRAIDSPEANENPDLKKQLNNLMAEEVLILKEGAQVMYLKNRDELIVNGSVGKVLFFMTRDLWESVRNKYGPYDPDMLDELRLLSSRIRNTEDWSDDQKMVYAQIPFERKRIFEALCAKAVIQQSALLPIVQFKDMAIMVEQEEFTLDTNRRSNSSSSSSNQITRQQLPLLLSWAMSIHKAQGQTIERLRINLAKTFENGQVYVALSRATSKESLEVYNFHPSKVRTAEAVANFYRALT